MYTQGSITKPLIRSLAAIAVLAAFMGAASAHAKKINLSSLKGSKTPSDPTARVEYQSIEQEHVVEQVIHNERLLNEMGERYNTLAIQREHRRNYQTQTLQQEMSYQEENRNMVRGYMLRTLRQKLRSMVYGLRKALQEDISTSRSEEREANNKKKTHTVYGNAKSSGTKGNQGKKTGVIPATQVAHIPGVSRSQGGNDSALEDALNEMVRIGHRVIEDYQSIPIAHESEARVSFDLPRTTAQVDFVSPVVDGDIQYRIGRGALPTSGADPQSGDHATVGISRQFPEITLATGVRYGVESSTMNYSVSKHIHGPLSAGVNRLQSLRDSNNTNTTVQLNLGLVF